MLRLRTARSRRRRASFLYDVHLSGGTGRGRGGGGGGGFWGFDVYDTATDCANCQIVDCRLSIVVHVNPCLGGMTD